MNNATVISGSFKTAEDATGKYIESLSGTATLSFPQPHAYGTWEFDLYYKANTDNLIGFMGNQETSAWAMANAEGYTFRIFTDKRLFLAKRVGTNNPPTYLNITTSVLVQDNTWYSVKITRTLSGLFSCYIKSSTDVNFSNWTLYAVGIGTNPVTDNTYTTSQFVVITLGTGSKIKNFRHSVGVKV